MAAACPSPWMCSMTSFTTTWTHSCAPLPFTAVAHFADTCSLTCANAPRRVHLEQELDDGYGRVDDDAGEKEPLTTASKTSKKRKHKSIKLAMTAGCMRGRNLPVSPTRSRGGRCPISGALQDHMPALAFEAQRREDGMRLVSSRARPALPAHGRIAPPTRKLGEKFLRCVECQL